MPANSGGWLVPTGRYEDRIAHWIDARSGEMACGKPVEHRTWQVAAMIEAQESITLDRCTQCKAALMPDGG